MAMIMKAHRSALSRFTAQSAASSCSSSRLTLRSLATHANLPKSDTPQTFVEKIVQKYAVDLNPGQRVQAGDYLSVKPQTVMTHDNTGPCITKVRRLEWIGTSKATLAECSSARSVPLDWRHESLQP